MEAGKALFVIGLSVWVLGCASVPAPPAANENLNAPHSLSEILQESPRESVTSTFVLESNERVNAWIDYFTVKDRDRFQRFLSRGEKYRKVIQDFLVENELPAELYYLALIESGYQNNATSSAKAAGLWQFMPATGRNYGLQVDRFVDERRDPIRATEAAAKYLRDLYNIFGSWPLAMSAYNAGEYRVIRSILKGKSRDYWTLVSLNMLPKETSDYVAKMLAATTIGASPEKYGFANDESELYPELEAVEVPSPVRLVDLARISELTTQEIEDVNPHLRNGQTPSNVSQYEVWFPKHNAALIRKQSSTLAQFRLKAPATRFIAKVNSKKNYHRVKAGENLAVIARAHGLSVSYLVKVNNLTGARIMPGMELRVTSRSYHPLVVSKYRVKRGDNLNQIARKFGSSVSQIKKDNSLERVKILPGQVLLIQKNNNRS